MKLPGDLLEKNFFLLFRKLRLSERFNAFVVTSVFLCAKASSIFRKCKLKFVEDSVFPNNNVEGKECLNVPRLMVLCFLCEAT